MFKKNIVFSFLIFPILFGACNSRNKIEKEADARLEQIARLIENNNWNTAKNEIDSIHYLYPRLVEKRKTAQAYKDTIERKEALRTISYCDSVLIYKGHEADSLKLLFSFEKNEQYQEYGNYIYKTMLIENNLNRPYLKAEVNENADFFLTAYYQGKSKLEYDKIKLTTANGLFAETDSIPELIFKHSFKDDGLVWETVSFKNAAAANTAMFIAQHQHENVKVNLQAKKAFSYNLLPNDKKAITETYNLWVVMSDVVQLEKEILKAKAKIAQIEKRHSKIRDIETDTD